MSYGNMAPYLRSRFGRQGQFATGSLLFDLERSTRKADAQPLAAHRPGGKTSSKP